MEKLIELLNEYEAKRKDKDWRFQRRYKLDTNTIWRTHTNLDSGWDTDYDNTNREIISKSYGFIKRLVDNNKIDREKINDRWGDMSIHFTDEQLFIMSLSISDTPIEDLILYLK